MSNDEVLRLVLEIAGQSAAEALASKLAAADAEADKLADALQNLHNASQAAAGGGLQSTIDDEARAVRSLNEEMARLGTETIDTTTAAFKRQASAAAGATAALDQVGKTAGKGGSMGQGLMQAAFFADDLQYGLRGIINNVPILLSSLGVGAAWAGGISIAVVGLGVMASKIGELTHEYLPGLEKAWKEAFEEGLTKPAQTGVEEVETRLHAVKKSLDEIEKKKIESSFDMNALIAARDKYAEIKQELKDIQELQALMNEKSDREKAVGEGFKKAVAETGPQRALDELQNVLEQHADERGLVAGGAVPGDFKPEELAKKLMLEASRGNIQARDEIKQHMEQFKQHQMINFGHAIPSPFLDQLIGQSPEEKERVKAEQKKQKEADDAAKKQESEERKQREKEAREADREKTRKAAAIEKDRHAHEQIKKHNEMEKKREEEKKYHEYKQESAHKRDELGSAGLDEAATQYALRLRSQGGDYDQNGQFHRMDMHQQIDAVAKAVQQQLMRANPNMNMMEASGHAYGTANKATKAIDHVIEARRQQLAMMGVQTTAQTQEAMGQSLAAMESMTQVLGRQGENAKRMKDKFKKLETKMPSLLNQGR